MKYLCLLLFSLLLYAHPCLSQDFLVGTEDIPLMADFQVSKDDTFSIDEQDGSGRLFFSKATTKNTEAAVKDFYSQTLPQLGWKEMKTGYFERDDDVLKISTDVKLHKTEVFFELITK